MNTFFLITSRRHIIVAALSASLLGATLSTVTVADNDHAAANLPEVNVVDGFSSLVQAVKPAVVNISVTGTVTSPRRQSRPFRGAPPEFEEFFRRFFGDQFNVPDNQTPYARKTTAVGSGFIIDPDGLVVTNNHVIEDADEIEVVFDDGTRMPARLRGTDSKTDLALLKIDGKKPFPYVIFGDSEKAKVGDWVVAIGNPFGLGGTTTQGIISARGRDIQSGLVDFIQIDAPINRGNSGGPLFNMKGEVIGINSAIFSPNGGNVGIGFAIPSAMASNVISQLQSTGSVQRGYLGIQIQTVNDEIADSLGLEEAQGALVTQIIAGSPADTAGLQAGDVIIEFDGKIIPRMRELPKIVALTEKGKIVDVVVWRNQKKMTIRVSVGGNTESDNTQSRERNQSDQSEDNVEVSMLGLSLSTLDDAAREQLQISKDSKGALITGVDPGSPAAERGMVRGELITKVGNEFVESPEDVNHGIRQAIDEGKQSVLMLVERSGRVRFVVIPLDF